MKTACQGLKQISWAYADCQVTEPSEKMANFWAVIHQGCIKHFQNKDFRRVTVLMMTWSLLALTVMKT